MTLSEELKQIYRNVLKDLNLLYEKIKLYPLISLLFIIAVLLIIVLPHWQVSGINNVTEKVTQENQSRAILAQIYGGIAVGIGIYFAWGNLSVARESQITERFNRAIGQLENEKLEIRLGGIHTLERIANESEKDYWPVMEILAAYVRINSSFKNNDKRPEIYENARDIQTDVLSILDIMSQINVSLDVETIVNIIKERKYHGFSYRDFNDDSKKVRNDSNIISRGFVAKNSYWEK